MPVYEYRCKNCSKTHEIEHGFNDERPTKCPDCGGPLVRVFHPIGVLFKGSGFHKTDYGAKSGAAQPAAGGETKAGDAKPGESKPAEGKTDTTKPGQGKSSESAPGEKKS